MVVQSCPTLCKPMDCGPPGSSVHGDSPGRNTGVGCCALLQEIFPTQGPNPGHLHCRQILYHLSHQGSKNTGVGSLSLLQGIFPTQELNQGLLHCRWILFQLSYQGSLNLQSPPFWPCGWRLTALTPGVPDNLCALRLRLPSPLPSALQPGKRAFVGFINWTVSLWPVNFG